MNTFDQIIVLFLNKLATRHETVKLTVVFFAEYATYIFVLGLILWWVLAKNKLPARKALVDAFVAFFLARLVFTEIIRAIIPRLRPFDVLPVVNLIGKESGSSLPSGHTVALAAIAVSLYFYNKKLGAGLFLLALVVGISRVAAGVHFPSDILTGVLVGAITAWAVNKIVSKKTLHLAEWCSRLTDKCLPSKK